MFKYFIYVVPILRSSKPTLSVRFCVRNKLKKKTLKFVSDLPEHKSELDLNRSLVRPQNFLNTDCIY